MFDERRQLHTLGELGRDAVVVERSVPCPTFYVHGVHVVHEISDGGEDPASFHIRTSDPAGGVAVLSGMRTAKPCGQHRVKADEIYP